MKLNLGSGRLPLEEYVNVDLHEEVDVKGDIRYLSFYDIEEVRMSHLLEHLPWADTVPVLERVKGWMRPGGLLMVEVPDMELIMAEAHSNPDWVAWVYGSQYHDGEYHKTGFTVRTLEAAIVGAGFSEVAVRQFRSEHPYRPGMPCLEATARV